MKHFYFSLFLGFLSFSSMAQTTYTLDSVVAPGFSKQIYSYDQLMRHINTSSFEFQGTTGVFILSDENSYTFNNNDLLVEQVFSTVQNNVLTPVVKTLLNYNTQDQVSSITNLWYDVAAATYWNSNKTDYIRDANGNVTDELFFSFNGGSWQLNGKMVYVYTGNVVTEMINQTTMNNGITFDNSAKQTYAYDQNGNPVEQIFLVWNNGAWDQLNKSTYAYDASNNCIQILSYNINGQNWDESFKEDMVYNGTNDITLYESFMKQGSNWSPQYKMANTYDLPLLQVLNVPSDYKYNSKIDIQEIYEPVGTVWSLLKTDNYFYTTETGTNGLSNSSLNQVKVYPNPSADMFTLSELAPNALVSLSDVLGKQLMLVVADGTELSIPVSELAEGHYLLTITNGAERLEKKIIVMK
jgi:hypothetical protein